MGAQNHMNKRLLVSIVITAVLLRVAVALIMGDQVQVLPGIYDQISYHTLAVRLIEGHGFTFGEDWWPVTKAGEPTAHWSYLYTLYLAAVYKLVGVHPLVARLIQAVTVGVLMPWLAYRLGKWVFPEDVLRIRRKKFNVAIFSALWVSLYLYFIYYGAALMTEAFYITGILWVLDCGLRIAYSHDFSRRRVVFWNWIELGLAIGITVLLRQVFLVFVPFLLLWVAWVQLRQAGAMWKKEAHKVLLGGILTSLMLGALILPFTIINYQQFERFVLLNTNAGYAFFWSNHPIHGDSFVALFTEEMPSYQDLIPKELLNLDEAALERELMKMGIKFVLEDPWRYIRLSISRIPDHFIFWPLPESSIISNLTRVGSIGLALPFMLLGGGTWAFKERKRKGSWVEVFSSPGGLLLLFIVTYTGVHLLSWSGIRYRLPTDAAGLIFAAGGALWLLNLMFNRKQTGVS